MDRSQAISNILPMAAIEPLLQHAGYDMQPVPLIAGPAIENLLESLAKTGHTLVEYLCKQVCLLIPLFTCRFTVQRIFIL
jgi:hypothetical protein